MLDIRTSPNVISLWPYFRNEANVEQMRRLEVVCCARARIHVISRPALSHMISQFCSQPPRSCLSLETVLRALLLLYSWWIYYRDRRGWRPFGLDLVASKGCDSFSDWHRTRATGVVLQVHKPAGLRSSFTPTSTPSPPQSIENHQLHILGLGTT